MNQNEQVYFLGDNNEVLGSISKVKAHQKGIHHSSIYVWIMNDAHEILLVRRSPNKLVYPNMFDTSFAGHISFGENVLDTCVREGKEELGITILREKLQFLFSYHEEEQLSKELCENETRYIFLYKCNLSLADITFSDGEATEAKYVSINSLINLWNDKNSNVVKHPFLIPALSYFLKKDIDQYINELNSVRD